MTNLARLLSLPVLLFGLSGYAVRAATCPDSANNTILNGGSTSCLTDSEGNDWAIPSDKGMVFLNGSSLPKASNAIRLAYVNRKVGYEDNSHQWFSFSANTPFTTNIVTIGTPATTSSLPSPTGNFRVSDGQIIGPNGRVWIGAGVDLHSANLGAAAAFAPGTTLPLIVKQFPGINLIRVTSLNYGESDPPAGYAAAVKTFTNLGIVVEFTDYGNSRGGGGGGAQGVIYTGTLLTKENNWFAAMATYYKGNPYVWLGSNNEPSFCYPDSGGTVGPCRGGSIYSSGAKTLSAWQRSNYDAVRNTGNNNIFFVEPSGSRPIGYVPSGIPLQSFMDKSYYTTMTNVVWDPHAYGYQNGYRTTTTDQLVKDLVASAQTIQSADGVVPAVIGEFGPGANLPTTATQDANGTQLVASVLKSGYGYGTWVWDTDAVVGGDSSGNNALLSRRNFTAYGNQVVAGIAASAAKRTGGDRSGRRD
jgi:hypothetical protein